MIRYIRGVVRPEGAVGGFFPAVRADGWFRSNLRRLRNEIVRQRPLVRRSPRTGRQRLRFGRAARVIVGYYESLGIQGFGTPAKPSRFFHGLLCVKTEYFGRECLAVQHMLEGLQVPPGSSKEQASHFNVVHRFLCLREGPWQSRGGPMTANVRLPPGKSKPKRWRISATASGEPPRSPNISIS